MNTFKKKATRRINNNKAIGYDEIQLDLITDGPQIHHQAVSNILNRIFEEHKNKINLVLSLQLPIPKSNKMKGLTKNRRPRKFNSNSSKNERKSIYF